MIYKLKDRKYFEEYLRKLFCKNAFIFFTLEKMILSATKTINNITT
jgi:histone deacetylase complex regulatory component SIN3